MPRMLIWESTQAPSLDYQSRMYWVTDTFKTNVNVEGEDAEESYLFDYQTGKHFKLRTVGDRSTWYVSRGHRITVEGPKEELAI